MAREILGAKLPPMETSTDELSATSLGHGGGGENSPASPDLRTRPLHEQIAACARELWRSYGCPVGRDEQIWLEAERQLLGADPQVARMGGATPADALNQAAPAPTAGSGGASPGRAGGDRAKKVSPDPASAGSSGHQARTDMSLSPTAPAPSR